MKVRYLAVVAAFALGLTHLIATTAASKPVEAARTAAQQWLSLVDGKKYAESWTKMAPAFKKEVSKRKWKKTIQSIRSPLGKVVSRKLKSAEYTKELPGAPEGEYVVITFETDFANRKGAVETVTPVLGQDLIWRVAGYSVK